MQWCDRQLERHAEHVVEYLQDLPQVDDWSLGDPIEQGD